METPALLSSPSRHPAGRMLLLIAAGQFFGMTLWFSATAAAPALATEFSITSGGTAWLTMAVQGGFVAGTLISAILNLADVFNARRLFAMGCIAGAVANGAIAFAESAWVIIALRFASDVELLVATMLSAQTTDVTVNRVTTALFQKYRRPEDYLAVSLDELEQDIRPTGTFRQKARNVQGAMRLLVDEYGGHVPLALSDLVRLPGVGRKTANVVAAERGATQGIVVDTHVRRLSQRLGLTRQDDPARIERDLQRVVPRADWARFPHLLIWHGRRVCIARAPRCADCVLNDLCPSSRV